MRLEVSNLIRYQTESLGERLFKPLLPRYDRFSTCHISTIGIPACLLVMLMVPITLAQPWRPPRILAEFTALPERPENENEEFGHEFCCPGDVNNDGFPDLLVLHETNARGDIIPYFYLYLGGDTISPAPALTFGPESLPEDIHGVYCNLFPIGYLIPQRPSLFSLGRYLDPQRGRLYSYELQLFECGEELDTIPDIKWSWFNGHGPSLGESGKNMKPGDYNGDGISDLLTVSQLDTNAVYQIYFGGNNFDTIPDWQTTIIGNSYITPRDFISSSGCDINNDGYDDALMRIYEWTGIDSLAWRGAYYFYMYLGGEVMDTLPLFRIGVDYYQEDWGNRRIGGSLSCEGFTLLPDINNDGYDDWAIYWTDRVGPNDDDGTYIFFGSENPDMEPDMNLEGTRRFGPGFGYPLGGDFNGDGNSDILVVYQAFGGTDLHYHFGSRWIRNDPDYVVYPNRDIHDIYDYYSNAGAVADYNSDGADDAVMYTWTREMQNDTIHFPERLIILSGDRRWRINDVKEEQPKSYELRLVCTPNPFNSEIQLSYTLERDGLVDLAIYDRLGRLVRTLIHKNVNAGDHNLVWKADTSGVYFAVLTQGDQKRTEKLVCLK